MIYEKNSFLLRKNVGTAKGEAGGYEMSLVNGHIPAVTCERTGRTYVLSWQEIINQAIEAGVSKELT